MNNRKVVLNTARAPKKRTRVSVDCEYTRRGTVLIVTMWVVLVLAGLVLVFARGMRVEIIASANQLAAAQTEWVGRAALAFVTAQVDGTDGTRRPGEDVSCEAVPVGNGYFWLLRPNPDDDTTYEFGIDDEAGKLNLNAATGEMLLMLPGMTDELAPAIIDWRSPDTAATPGGAKSEYYLLLSPPYNCKNGPLETVEEVLLVKGADMAILFGEDINRNGFLDPNENDGDDSPPADNRDGYLDRGSYHFVTVYSTEAGVGQAAGPGSRQNGLINVNSAPRQILLCLPGLEAGDVDALLAKRASPDTNLSSVAWVAQALPAEKAAAIRNWVTVRSYQFSADIVAVSGNGRAFKRFRAVLDARTSPPQVVCWQELTGLGWPLAPEILAALRSGSPLPVTGAVTTTGGPS